MGRLNDLVAESFKIATEKGWHESERSLSAFKTAAAYEIDLWAVIEDKAVFNRTRSRRHGGKKI